MRKNIIKILVLWFLPALAVSLFSGCGSSVSSSGPSLSGTIKPINIIALPIADYCPDFYHDGAGQRQTAINDLIFARLKQAGLSNFNRDEMLCRLLKEGIMQKNDRMGDIDFFDPSQWNGITEKMVSGITPLNSLTPATKPQQPLNMKKIFSLGRLLKADYVLRGRIVPIDRPDLTNLQKADRLLLFYLELNKQPVVLSARAGMYDPAFRPENYQAAADRIELQLFLLETASGNIVWQGKTQLPAVISSGFSAHEPFQKSLKKMKRLAGELLDNLIRQSAYSAAEPEKITPEQEMISPESLPEPYPVPAG